MATAATQVKTRTRGHLWCKQGSGQAIGWYAVALSEDLQNGEVRGIDVCDGRIAIYRSQHGSVHAVSTYCPHMGADLTLGEVVGDELRCAFHHWQFGSDGACSKIPSGDRTPRSARLHTFSVEERWGLIWVYWGNGQPLYPVPSFRDWDDRHWVSRAFRVPMREAIHVEPWVSAPTGSTSALPRRA